MTKNQIQPSQFDSVFRALLDECTHGKTHLTICKGIAAADPVLLDLAPVFFGYSFYGNLTAAQMCVNKIFDTDRRAMSIDRRLRKAENHKARFAGGKPSEVTEAVGDSHKQIKNSEVVIKGTPFSSQQFHRSSFSRPSSEPCLDPKIRKHYASRYSDGARFGVSNT